MAPDARQQHFEYDRISKVRYLERLLLPSPPDGCGTSTAAMLAVLRAVDSVCRDHAEKKISIVDIATKTGLSRSAVKRALASLKGQSLLAIAENRRGGWRPSTYRIVWSNVRALVDEVNPPKAMVHDEPTDGSPRTDRWFTTNRPMVHGEPSRDPHPSFPRETQSLIPERLQELSEDERFTVGVIVRRLMNVFLRKKKAKKVSKLPLEEYVYRIAFLRSSGQLSEHEIEHALKKAQAEEVNCPAYYFDKCLRTELNKNPGKPVDLDSLLCQVPIPGLNQKAATACG